MVLVQVRNTRFGDFGRSPGTLDENSSQTPGQGRGNGTWQGIWGTSAIGSTTIGSGFGGASNSNNNERRGELFSKFIPGEFVSDLFFSSSRQVRLSLNKVHLHFWQAPASMTRGIRSRPQWDGPASLPHQLFRVLWPTKTIPALRPVSEISSTNHLRPVPKSRGALPRTIPFLAKEQSGRFHL